MNKEILSYAKELQDEIVQIRRGLHKIPEVHTELPMTKKFIKNELEKIGCEVIEIGGGLVTNIGDSKKGKTILLRGDIDALPIKEEVDLDFKSTNDNMHACGHDIHGSSLIGAAKILKKYEKDLNGNVKLMFQPAEETLVGAENMIKDGLLENPKVDAAIGIHVFSGFPIEPGILMIPVEGPASMSPDEFHINIKGEGGHGAMPHQCIDPLNIAAHTHIALQELVAREVNPAKKGICVVGQMNGGTASNVVADTAKLIGCLRTTDPDIRKLMKQRLIEISEGTARTFRGSAEVEYTLECPSMINNGKLRSFGINLGEELFGSKNVMDLETIMEDGILNGSEDFAYVTEKIPSSYFIFTMGDSREGYKYPHHNPKVKFDESAFYKVSAF